MQRPSIGRFSYGEHGDHERRLLPTWAVTFVQDVDLRLGGGTDEEPVTAAAAIAILSVIPDEAQP
jgi:hypothetical protein